MTSIRSIFRIRHFVTTHAAALWWNRRRKRKHGKEVRLNKFNWNLYTKEFDNPISILAHVGPLEAGNERDHKAVSKQPKAHFS